MIARLGLPLTQIAAQVPTGMTPSGTPRQIKITVIRELRAVEYAR